MEHTKDELRKRHEKLVDYDLDVENLFKDFPKDDENAMLYLRGTFTNEMKGTCFMKSLCNNQTLTGMFLTVMFEHEIFKMSVFDAVLNILNNDEIEKQKFLSFINDNPVI